MWCHPQSLLDFTSVWFNLTRRFGGYLGVIVTSLIENLLPSILLASSVQSSIEIMQGIEAVDHVTFHMTNNIKSPMDNPFIRTTYPSNWISYYLLNNLVMVDPVMAHALVATKPFSWDVLRPTAKEVAFLEKSREFGLGASGFSCPCLDSYGRKSVLSLNSSLPTADWTAFVNLNGQELANLAHDIHVKAVAEAFADRDSGTQLSPREYECLKWTSQGKTYSEIAIILDLSEHTVRSYLKVARLKLDSVSLAQAVAKASNFGLI